MDEDLELGETEGEDEATSKEFDPGGEVEAGLPLPRVLAAAALAVGLGIIGGYLLAQRSPGAKISKISPQIPESGVQIGQVFGSPDEETFKDKAVGVVEKSLGTSEGTHKLVRDPDNPSQTAYLVSSVVDLDKVLGRKVEVGGETVYSEKVGWLMDVGRVKVVE